MTFWEFLHAKTEDWDSTDWLMFTMFCVIPIVCIVGVMVVAIIHGPEVLQGAKK